MPVADCRGLEGFIEAASLIQERFFKRELAFGRTRLALRELCQEAIADDPDCRDLIRQAAKTIEDEITETEKQRRSV